MQSMPQPCPRIVPKNLFLSAQRALSDETIRAQKVTVSNLSDLCTLISLSMLYDNIETLGSQRELDPDYKPHIAPEYDRLRQLTGLEISVGPRPSELDDVVNQSVPFAIVPFLQNLDFDPKRLKSDLKRCLREGISDGPDYWEDFAEGERLSLEHAPGAKRSMAEKFWQRSFIYAGLAESRHGALVPDTVRAWGIARPKTGSHDYARDLEDAIAHKYPPGRLRQLVLGTGIQVSPFAAVVFLRAGKNHKKIPEVMKELREEMAPVRSALSSLQWERELGDYRGFITIFAKAHNEDSRLAVDDRMEDAIQALRSAKFPIPPQLVALKPAFDVVWSAVSLIKSLAGHSPAALSTIKTLIGLAHHAQDVQAADNRTAFLEVHYRLGWDLKEWFNCGVDVRDLFGPIHDDEPKRGTP
jgi:hypothetical protein